jgi:hypothetical protein
MICYLKLYHDWRSKKREPRRTGGDENPRLYKKSGLGYKVLGMVRNKNFVHRSA